jgi:hypothetical protein
MLAEMGQLSAALLHMTPKILQILWLLEFLLVKKY